MIMMMIIIIIEISKNLLTACRLFIVWIKQKINF